MSLKTEALKTQALKTESPNTGPLDAERRKHYRRLGHNLKPVVTIAAKGLSNSVQGELQRALEDHELIKVKLAINDREARKAVLQALLSRSGAALVQEIGKVALIFRAAKQRKPRLSNIPDAR